MAYGRLFYCNQTKGTLGTASGSSSTGNNILGIVRFGDILKLSLRIQKEINSRVVDSEDNFQSVKVTLGKKDARPTGGTFRLKFEGRSETTEPLAKNASPEEVKIALDHLSLAAAAPSVPANQWSVKYVNGSYIASIPSGLGYWPIDVAENRLTPTSFVTHKSWEQDGLKYQEIRLVQAPCAVTTDYSLVVPNPPYITRILAGQYPSEFSMGVDEVQGLRIPTEFRGNFQIKRDQAGSQPVGTSPDAAILKEALDAMSKALGGTYTVTTPSTTGDKAYNITFGGKLGQSPQPLLTVQVIDNPQGDLTFTMPLNTTSLHEAIRDGNGSASLVLEAEAEITDTVSGGEPTTIKTTLFSIPVTIQARLSEAEVTALSDTNWAVPPDPASYIPYSPTQVLFGSQHYQAVIPNPDTSGPVEIQHNLNTGNQTPYGLHVSIRINAANGRYLKDSEYTITHNDHNRLTISAAWGENWDLGPAGVGGSYIVIISTAGPRSAFQAHTHSITEITGLSSVLSDLGNQVSEIIAVMPVVRNQLTSSTQQAVDFQTPLNATFFLLGCSKYKNNSKIPPYGTEEGDYLMKADGTWQVDKLPTMPRLLPAIHDSEITDTTILPNKNSAEGVYRNSGSLKWKVGTTTISQNEFAAVSDGLVYKVFQPDVAKPSFYATEYEKTLFTFVTNQHVLPVGRYMQFKFGVGYSSYLANVAAKFLLIIEHGPFIEEQAVSYGPNLERLSYDKQPIVTPIIISPQPQQFFAGLRVSNTLRAVDPNASPIVYEQVILQDKFLMGSWSGTSSSLYPAGETFAVRARISQFDIENTPGASGYIQIALLAGLDESDTPQRGEYGNPLVSFKSIS